MKATFEYWGDTPVLLDVPTSPETTLIFAHGAGAPMDSGFMEEVSRSLSARGIAVVRFEFPYMARLRTEARKFPPNRMPVLLESWRKVISLCQERFSTKTVVAGKSMGGRAASMLMAEHVSGIAGGVVFGYPFHPPGKPSNTRVEHLPLLQRPLLVLQGSRDGFGRPEEVAAYTLGDKVQVQWLDTGDHDFKPLKKSGLTQSQLIATACDACVAFVRELREG